MVEGIKTQYPGTKVKYKYCNFDELLKVEVIWK